MNSKVGVVALTLAFCGSSSIGATPPAESFATPALADDALKGHLQEERLVTKEDVAMNREQLRTRLGEALSELQALGAVSERQDACSWETESPTAKKRALKALDEQLKTIQSWQTLLKNQKPGTYADDLSRAAQEACYAPADVCGESLEMCYWNRVLWINYVLFESASDKAQEALRQHLFYESGVISPGAGPEVLETPLGAERRQIMNLARASFSLAQEYEKAERVRRFQRSLVGGFGLSRGEIARFIDDKTLVLITSAEEKTWAWIFRRDEKREWGLARKADVSDPFGGKPLSSDCEVRGRTLVCVSRATKRVVEINTDTGAAKGVFELPADYDEAIAGPSTETIAVKRGTRNLAVARRQDPNKWLNYRVCQRAIAAFGFTQKSALWVACVVPLPHLLTGKTFAVDENGFRPLAARELQVAEENDFPAPKQESFLGKPLPHVRPTAEELSGWLSIEGGRRIFDPEGLRELTPLERTAIERQAGGRMRFRWDRFDTPPKYGVTDSALGRTRRLRAEFDLREGGASLVSVSPDGETLVAGTKDEWYVLDVVRNMASEEAVQEGGARKEAALSSVGKAEKAMKVRDETRVRSPQAMDTAVGNLIESDATIPAEASKLIARGVAYWRGEGEDRDYVRAVEAFESAAAQGSAVAATYVGIGYQVGLGVEQSDVKAAEWYRRAAEKGERRAQAALGNAYLEGIGVTRDEKKGVEWLGKSANQGASDAQVNLGLAFEQGRGVKANAITAVEWFQKAADQGSVEAQVRLGAILTRGPEKVRDINKGMAHLQEAAAKGNVEAMRRLGELA